MEEGYIEVANQGMRIVGWFTTKHLLSIVYGICALLPLSLLLFLIGMLIPGHSPYLPYIGVGVGSSIGIVIGICPVPKRRTTLMNWLYKRIRYQMKPQVFVFDQEYRMRTNRAKNKAWMARVEAEYKAAFEKSGDKN